ncbi:MAG: MBL fold metallo-hydrolase [Myxococcota bacterium]
MRRAVVTVLVLTALTSCSGASDDPVAPGEASVSFTWLGVTHWLVQHQDKTILLDAYFSRPAPDVTEPTEEGLDLMQRVLDAAGVDTIDLILVGHSHFDHAVDCGAVALRTGAQVVGTQTTCLVAEAEGLPSERCTIVGTGDRVDIDGVSIRTIRTIHSNPTGIGLFDELDRPPSNVFNVPIGGVVSFLIDFGDDLTVLYQNSIGPLDGDDSSLEDYAANLEAVLGDAPDTTLWLSPVGFLSDAAELTEYYDRVRPRFVLAHHWDGLTPDIEAGTVTSFQPSTAVTEATEAAGAALSTPDQYFDRFVLTPDALVRSDEAPVRDAFGL